MEYPSSASRETATVALSSVAASFLLTAMKVVVGLWTGSLGILSEALHSGLDLIAAIITFVAVRVSARPADRTHLYGHGKVENVSALIETALLLITCFWIIQEAIDRLLYRTVVVEVNFWSFFVIIISIAVDYSRSRALHRVARKHRSQALEADALHFSTDIWSSSVVLLGLLLTLLRIPVADSVAALVVALIVVYVSLSLGKRTIDDLLDRAPAGVEERIRDLARTTEGVERVGDIRVRTSGPRVFIDLALSIRRTLPFEAAHALVHKVEESIRHIMPTADTVIHADPVPSAYETVTDKVKLMMAREGLIAHDVQVFKREKKYQVEFQLEFRRQEEFVRVHETVDALEQRIKSEIPDVEWVVVHIEDSKEEVVEPVDVTPLAGNLIHEIESATLSAPEVIDCTILTVLEVGGKYFVSMNVVLDPRLTLEEVHDVSTALEHRILVAHPSLREVHIHAEPSDSRVPHA